MLTSIFNWTTNIVQNGFDNTFGQMSGKEILWTIMGLLAIYQLLMIKWRLIDQNRRNQVPTSYLTGIRSQVRGLTPMRTVGQFRNNIARNWNGNPFNRPQSASSMEEDPASIYLR